MWRVISSVLHRFAMVCPGGASMRPRLHRWRGVHIGSNVWMGLYVYVDDLHPEALTIGDNCTIGIRTSIVTHFYRGPRQATSNGRVTIERDVFIGPHCVILPNVTIGEGAVIQAGSIVTRSVPRRALWGPVPSSALGTATVPLTDSRGYQAFLGGLRPLEHQ